MFSESMEVDIDSDTIHSLSKAALDDTRSEVSLGSENENDKNILQKIEEILKPLCDTVHLILEKKICSFDKSEFLKIYNPLSDQYFRFFPSLHLIIHIEAGNMNIRLFFEHRRVVREAIVSSLEEHLSNPEEYLGTVTVLSTFLAELCARKYDICHGAFHEETFQGDFSLLDLRSVLIESGDGRIVYRSRQCQLLISKGTTSCQSCLELCDSHNQQQQHIGLNSDEEVCDPLDLLEVNIDEDESENKGNVTEEQIKNQVKPIYCKPKISYKKLIMGAIEDSPERRLKLNDIYEWILSRYPSFSNNRTGFQNSIRHNLSLNKVFIKVDGPQQGGKGGFWTINPKLDAGLVRTSNVPDKSNKSKMIVKRLQPGAGMDVELKPKIVSCKSVFFDSRSGQEPDEPSGGGKLVQEPEVTITTIPANLSSLTGITVNIKNQSQPPDRAEFNPTIPQLANCKTENVPLKSVESVLQSLKPVPISAQPTFLVNPEHYSKPTFSYKELIMISIYSDAAQAMCLHDIYLTIQKWFPYFQRREIGATWQNSIRHNLSLNKCFQRLNTYLPTKVRAPVDYVRT